MILIFALEITSEKHEVTTIHYKPEILDSTQRIGGYEIGSIPEEPTPLMGKLSVLYYNPQNGDLWYEYKDRPLTQEEIIQHQNEQLNLIQQALDDLILGGAF